ncbi:MAG: FAD-dependent thymidylate synthase [Clostridia bacterium]|nr:FAD-dependent thymidylate synthase [Clostridia bacterium]
MKVKIISPTYPDIINYIAESARICYGKEFENKEKNDLSTVTSLLKKGHHSVFECIYIEWYIENMSRACATQALRHRHISPLQQSQRYVNYIDKDDFWNNMVIPDLTYMKTRNESTRSYEDAMQIIDNTLFNIKTSYQALVSIGVRPEDARSILPQCSPTTLKIGMNLREFLFNFYPLRSSSKAQAEIRELAENMNTCLFEHFAKQKDFWQFMSIYSDWKDAQNRPEWK